MARKMDAVSEAIWFAGRRDRVRHGVDREAYRRGYREAFGTRPLPIFRSNVKVPPLGEESPESSENSDEEKGFGDEMPIGIPMEETQDSEVSSETKGINS